MRCSVRFSTNLKKTQAPFRVMASLGETSTNLADRTSDCHSSPSAEVRSIAQSLIDDILRDIAGEFPVRLTGNETIDDLVGDASNTVLDGTLPSADSPAENVRLVHLLVLRQPYNTGSCGYYALYNCLVMSDFMDTLTDIAEGHATGSNGEIVGGMMTRRLRSHANFWRMVRRLQSRLAERSLGYDAVRARFFLPTLASLSVDDMFLLVAFWVLLTAASAKDLAIRFHEGWGPGAGALELFA